METHSRKRDKRILNFLSKAAEALDHGGLNARLAAAIVIRNEIISIGFNRKKSHPFQAQYQGHEGKIYLHAETDAINRAMKYVTRDELKRAKLYIARVKYTDNKSKRVVWGQSKPCNGCQRAINAYGITTVIHTCDEQDFVVIH
jgi:deoxycytidylate deaminase